MLVFIIYLNNICIIRRKKKRLMLLNNILKKSFFAAVFSVYYGAQCRHGVSMAYGCRLQAVTLSDGYRFMRYVRPGASTN